MRLQKPRLGLVLAFAVLALSGLGAYACTIPVFRHALELWPAEDYEVVIFRKGALGPEDAERAKWLRKVGQGDVRRANLRVVDADLTGRLSDDLAGLWKSLRSAKAPWIVLRRVCPRPDLIWHGALNAESVAALVDSPVRKELRRRISQGHSAVWILLDGDDARRSTKIAASLESQLGELEKALKLPEPEDATVDEMERLKGLVVRFSLIRVPRHASEERILRSMLLSSEKNLAALGGPKAFPVFGKGRVLYALVDNGITAQNVGEACEFLVGSCSCTDSELKPGAALLMWADWKAVAGPSLSGDDGPPPLVGVPPSLVAPRSTGAPLRPKDVAAAPSVLPRTILITLIAGAVTVLLGCLIVLKRGGDQ